jgi:hypothetical protein
MPRLSNELYIDRHRFLRKMWLECDELYSILEVNQQWEVHRFYQPSKELSEEELIAHRKAITKEQPGLPAVAGRHFALLYQSFRVAYAYADGDEMRFRSAISQMSRQRPPHQTGKRQVWVRAVANPEPDLAKLASALIDLALYQAAEEG